MDSEKRSAHDFENTPKTWRTVVDWVKMAKPGHSLSGLELGYGWVRACSLGGWWGSVDGLGEGREAPPIARDTVKHCDAQDSESKGIRA